MMIERMIDMTSVRSMFAFVYLLIAGCATSPAVLEQQQKTEEDIATILSQPLDAAEYGEPENCLTSAQYRDFSVLDDQRIVFEGSRGRLWLNQLRMRCPENQNQVKGPDSRSGDLIERQFQSGHAVQERVGGKLRLRGSPRQAEVFHPIENDLESAVHFPT